MAHVPAEPVLIVGAGPVGLVVACELRRRGVPVRVVDRSRTPTAQSKAIIIWPRTLELLNAIGVAEQMVSAGHRLDGVRFHSNGSPIGTVSVSQLADSRFNAVLMLPQWETERILQERFAELGGIIEWGVELVDLVGDQRSRVHAVLRDPAGRTENVQATWLVGADGAHSTVRKQLSVGYTVHTPNMTFAIADAPVTGEVDETHLHYCYSARGALGVGPLGDGLFRFAVSVKEGQQPTRELFQAALKERAGWTDVVGEPRWSALFTVRCATADLFRVGRSFLVGDAAHVVSPAGGQGLNTGIHDAANLGWKLAGVALGMLHEDVLDSYHDERHEAVGRVSATTDKQTRWGLLTRPGPVLARDLAVRAAAASGVLQRVLAPLFSQTDLSYGPAQPWWQLTRYPVIRAGGRLPYLADRCGTDPSEDPSATTLPRMVLSSGRVTGDSWRRTRERLLAAAPAPLPTLDLNATPGTAEGELVRLLGPEPTALLVRPDGHVLAAAPADQPEELFGPVRSLVLAAPLD